MLYYAIIPGDQVLTRYSTLAWLVQSPGLNEGLGRWAELLSNWTLEVRRCEKEEDEILGTSAASGLHGKRSVSLIRPTFVSHTLSDNIVPYRLWLEDIYRNRVFIEAT